MLGWEPLKVGCASDPGRHVLILVVTGEVESRIVRLGIALVSVIHLGATSLVIALIFLS